MQITLHQALFGYDGGHQLLAASIGLPTDPRHYLAVATDLSGSAPKSGFDRAYSGLPVPGSDFYALFCTWLAPEMPRPGCVWSHVLLIELADLALLPDLGDLRQLFRRPAKPDHQAWRNPIPFSPRTSAVAGIATSLESEATELLELLYITPTAPVVKEVQCAETSEGLVFAIWSQQWPKLRRSFRFSTGSFADRGRGGSPFDLQLTPTGNLRAWQRGDHREPRGRPAVPAGDTKAPETWFPFAVADLRQPDMHGFRSFLHRYGADISEPRAAFARLATAYEVLRQKQSDAWLEKLKAIAVLFPKPPEALRLKQSVVTPRDDLTTPKALHHAWSIVSFIFTAAEAAAYAEVPLDHAGLAPLLWRERQEDVLSLLGAQARKEESPAAVSFAIAIANTIQPIDLRAISDRHSELIPILLAHRPSLAFDAATWKLRGYLQSQIFEALSNLHLPQEVWQNILGAMFIADTHVSIRDVVEQAGPLAMPGAFRWLEHSTADDELPSRAWREALAPSAAALLRRTTDLSPPQLALAAWCASTHDVRGGLFASRRDVQRLANEPPGAIPPPLRDFTAFLLVTLGLRENSDVAADMILRNFFPVHRCLASGAYSSEFWWLLAPELPTLGSWRDWDRCERLRRAVHSALAQRNQCGRLLEHARTSDERKIARAVAENATVDSSPEFLD